MTTCPISTFRIMRALAMGLFDPVHADDDRGYMPKPSGSYQAVWDMGSILVVMNTTDDRTVFQIIREQLESSDVQVWEWALTGEVVACC